MAGKKGNPKDEEEPPPTPLQQSAKCPWPWEAGGRQAGEQRCGALFGFLFESDVIFC